jgi:hypothetical protein
LNKHWDVLLISSHPGLGFSRQSSLLLLLPPLLLLPDSMEYLLRAMFSDVPRRHHHQHHRSSPRNAAAAAAGGSAAAADGAQPEGAAGSEGADGAAAVEVVTCVSKKRALHVEVVLKRLRMPPEALAAAINLLNTDQLKVCWSIITHVWGSSGRASLTHHADVGRAMH